MFIITLFLVIAIAVFVEKMLYRYCWKNGLEVKLQAEQCRLSEEDILKMKVVAANRKRLPLFALRVMFDVPEGFVDRQMEQGGKVQSFRHQEVFALLSRQMVIREISFRCLRRGVYHFDQIELSNQSLFLDLESKMDVTQNLQVSVAPACVAMNSFVRSFQTLFGSLLSNEFDYEDEFLIKGIREYQSYDGFRSVNWNATARLSKLMVNTYEHVTNRKVTVFLNVTPDQVAQSAEITEEGIRLAKTWCLNLEQNGIDVQLYTNGIHGENGAYVSITDACPHGMYAPKLDEALAYITVADNEKSFWEICEDEIEDCIQDYYMIFISTYQHEDFQTKLKDLAKRTRNFTWIIPINSMSMFRPEPQLVRHVIKWESAWKREGRSESFVI